MQTHDRRWTASLLLTVVSCLICMTGCLTRTEVLYSRATRLPKEIYGTMRLAQSEVRVNVTGTNKIGRFKTVNPSGYILVHEQDLAKLVENTAKLQELLNDGR